MNRDKLIAIGEALIDFMPQQSGVALDSVSGFSPAVGGAPANVCGAFSKLGGKSAMITQLGVDGFGDKIVKEFIQNNIDCSYVLRTSKANTSLAFVALKEDGSREFSFYRNPGADMLYPPECIEESWFEDSFALHFCSVSLGDFPMKDAHKRAIEYAIKHNVIISFDPNLRPALWSNTEDMVSAVRELLPMADIVKVSDEELELISETSDFEEGINNLFQGRVKVIIYTEGSKGAKVFTKISSASTPGISVKAIDTTGAGDGFIGAFLYKLYSDSIDAQSLSELTSNKLLEYISFSNIFCSISVQTKGAIVSYPTLEMLP